MFTERYPHSFYLWQCLNIVFVFFQKSTKNSKKHSSSKNVVFCGLLSDFLSQKNRVFSRDFPSFFLSKNRCFFAAHLFFTKKSSFFAAFFIFFFHKIVISRGIFHHNPPQLRPFSQFLLKMSFLGTLSFLQEKVHACLLFRRD